MSIRALTSASALALLFGLAGGSVTAFAQQPNTVERIPEQDECDPNIAGSDCRRDRVVITGSNIAGAAESAALPVEVYTQEDNLKSGNQSTMDFIKTLSVVGSTVGETNQFQAGYGNIGSSSLNLRGLGGGRTLTIFNGRRFSEKTTAPNQLWQTDFTYLKVTGWGWFYLSTILDDFSRYIIAWKLCTTMRADDVTATVETALEASGLDERPKANRPRLLSDNGSSYIAGDLAEWLDKRGIVHVRGAPSHPQTQGKIERWHQTLKNCILLENYYLPGDLEAQIGDFVSHYNHRRYHESLGNLTPADVYSGRGHTILMKREAIKQRTFEQRRLQHARCAA